MSIFRPGYTPPSRKDIGGPQLYYSQCAEAQDLLLSVYSSAVPDLLRFMSDDEVIPKALGNTDVLCEGQPIIWWSSLERECVGQDTLSDGQEDPANAMQLSLSSEPYRRNCETVWEFKRQRSWLCATALCVNNRMWTGSGGYMYPQH